MSTITLSYGDGKTRQLKLQAPKSFALRHEIAAAAGSNWRRAFIAALAVCWVSPGRPKTSYSSCDYNPLAFGGKVIDELDAQGYDFSELLAAGVEAFNLLAEGMLTEAEVSDAEGNSDAPAGA
jgi:hypothetical protein